MNSLLFLLAGAGIAVMAAMRENRKLKKLFSRRRPKFGLLPQAVTLLLVAAQLSELLKVVSQASPVSLVATLFLLAIVAASRAGTESERR